MKKWNKSRYFNLSNNLYNINQAMVLSLAIDEIKEGNISSILDLGCNNGYVLEEILRINNKRKIFTCSLDIDYNTLTEALARKVRVVRANVNSHLPFKDGIFELIIPNQLLEHLYCVDNFFKEVHRILKMNGRAIISTPSLSAWHNIFCLLLGWQPVGVHVIDIQVGNF